MPAFPLTSAWLKVASTGQSVEVQNLSPNPVVITTGLGVPVTFEGLLLDPREAREFALLADLYARAGGAGPATVSVVGGFSLGGGGGAGMPFATVLPAISGSATVGATLAATTGSWTGAPSGYGYRWTRNGNAIGGATASTYSLVAADAGAAIAVVVTATNASGSASATSAAGTVAAGSTPGGGASSTADFTDPNNAYLAALAA